MSIVEEKWPEILDYMKKEFEIMDVSFNVFIKPLRVFQVVDQTVYVLVSDSQSIDFIEKKYKLRLKVSIAEVTKESYEVALIEEGDANLKKLTKTKAAEPKQTKTVSDYAGLNPKYTFDTFVVGGNNRFAHAVSVAVAESPGTIYNPLFLYGGVGLGKTHLMHSVAHFILNEDPTKKVLYTTSESFTNDLINALRNSKDYSTEDFRQQYRDNDVLLIDDIQFLIGKESTQEEFFHTFNHLHTLGKQIIISSDRPPKDIETLEARLRTRFEMGLIADISSPDYETRMAILKKKIELDQLEKYNIPVDVLEYIATNVKTNIRELEGSLNKLIALYKLEQFKRDIDITLAYEALKDIISSANNREVTPQFILETVSEHFGMTINEIKSNKRNADLAHTRQIVMYLCREMTDAPLKSIAALLARSDHTTVKHGVSKIEKQLQTDETLSNTIDIIKKKINPV